MKKSNSPKSINAQANALLVANLLKEVNTSRLAELVNRAFNGEDLLRVCLYLNGSLTVPTFTSQKMIKQNSDSSAVLATFVSYDVFSDNISYEYDTEVTRYFDSQERADKWLADENPYEYAGERKETGNYVFPATRVLHRYSSCNSQYWEEQKNPECPLAS